MAILVQCTECKRKYYADEKTAGKRVRCKHCGALFDVPVGGSALSVPSGTGELDIESALEGLIGPEGAEPSAPGKPVVKTIAPVSKTLNAVSSAMSRVDDVQAMSVDGDAPVRDFRRPNWAWRYPGSKWVDQGLPFFLVVVGLGFTAWAVYADNAGNAADVKESWVVTLRVSLLFLILLALIFPLATVAVHKAARKLRYALPNLAWWRILSALTVPFVLGVMMWLPIGSVGGLIMGTVVGLGIAALVLWVLLRLRTEELTLTAVYASLGFLLGAVVGTGLLLLVNFLVFQGMMHDGTAVNYRASPLGRHFAWNPPAPPPVKLKPRPPVTPTSTPSVAVVPTSGPSTTSATQMASTGQPGTRPVDDGHPAGPFTEDVPQTRVDPRPPTSAKTGAQAGGPRATTSESPKPTMRAGTPIVSQVQVLEVGKFDEVLYPLTAGESLATINRSSEEDEIESWALAPLKQKGTVRFRHEPQAHDRYALSPGGDLVARLVNWPAVAAQVWSFDEKRLLKHIDLNKDNRDIGTPQLLGFVGPDVFVVKWLRGGAAAFGIYNASEGTLLRTLNKLPVHEELPGNPNYAFSPDGKVFALAVKYSGKATAMLYDLMEARPLRQVDIPLDAKWPVQPAGFAFSPESQRLGALFEQHGNGLLVAWNVKVGATKELARQIYPGGYGFSVAGDHYHPSVGLAWLREDVVVLFGQGLFDLDSGRLLGEFGLGDVKDQQVVDRDTIHLVLSPKTAPDQKLLVALKIDSAKLTEAKEQAR